MRPCDVGFCRRCWRSLGSVSIHPRSARKPRPRIADRRGSLRCTAPGRPRRLGGRRLRAVYHTIDGGRHWQGQRTPTTQHLYGVSFGDAENGWAVGRSGTIIHTADGGAHWVTQQSKTSKHLFKVRFSIREGAGRSGTGVWCCRPPTGASLARPFARRGRIVYAIDFSDRETGWIVGELGSIRHTVDGGETWARKQAGTRKTLFGLAAVSKDKAWAVGIDGLVVRTVDGGVTWQVQRGEGGSRASRESGSGVPGERGALRHRDSRRQGVRGRRRRQSTRQRGRRRNVDEGLVARGVEAVVDSRHSACWPRVGASWSEHPG